MQTENRALRLKEGIGLSTGVSGAVAVAPIYNSESDEQNGAGAVVIEQQRNGGVGGGGLGVPLALKSFETTSSSDGRLTWNYFDEAAYVAKDGVKQGEDPYIRNRFNQEASDSLPSNREIPDTRNAMLVLFNS